MGFVNYSVFYKDLKTRGLEYAAKHSRKLGFDAVEFLEVLTEQRASGCHPDSAKEVKRVLDDSGLSVSCFSVAVDLQGNGAEERTEQMMRLIEFAAKVGSPRFHHTLVPGLEFQSCVESYGTVLDRIYPRAKRIADCCAAYGIECLYEPQGCYFNGVEGLRGFYERIKGDCDNVGICGDVANGLFADCSAREFYDAFVDEIRHVHVKDYRMTDCPDPNKVPYVSRKGRFFYDCSLGAGVTDFHYCFEKLKQAGYRGDISFEMAGDDREILRSMEFLKTTIKEVYGYEI